MKETFSRGALALLAGLALSAPARLAVAQPRSAVDIAQARELFNQAMDLREKGKPQDALAKFEAANALAGTPITATELGKTYAAVGKLVEARETFLSVARIAVVPGETARAKAARKEAADLAESVRPRIASLGVHVDGVPLDTVAVTIDGAAVPSEALAAPRMVNPGAHKVVATTTAGGSAEATVEVKEGESRSVDLKIVLTAAPSPAGSAAPSSLPSTPEDVPASTGSSGPGALFYAGAGVAVAGVAVGTVTGLMSLSKASTVKNACDGLTCPTSIDGDLTSGRTLGTVSTIAFAVGGAGAVVAVVGLLVHPHHEAPPAASAWITPYVGPGVAGLSGGF